MSADFDDELRDRFTLTPKHKADPDAPKSSTERWHDWKDRQERNMLLAKPSIEIPREYLAELVARGQAPAETMNDRGARDRFVAAVIRRALGLE